jgi:hypothetical protein
MLILRTTTRQHSAKFESSLDNPLGWDPPHINQVLVLGGFALA